MPLLSPIPPAKRGKGHQKPALTEGTVFDHDSKLFDCPKGHHKKTPALVNRLCPLGRRIKGNKTAPRYIQEATVALYVHLKKCQLCQIPNRPPLNGKTMQIANKLIEIGLFTPEENGHKR